MPWGSWEWTFFKHQHSPSVPQITMLIDMRVVALSQKDNNFATYIKLIRSHSSIAPGDYSSTLPLRIFLVVTPVLQAEGTKVPGSNQMDITRLRSRQDNGPHALQARIVLARHTHPIRTMVLRALLTAHNEINLSLRLLFDIVQQGAHGVTASNLHHS